jgi:hypothetical protein
LTHFEAPSKLEAIMESFWKSLSECKLLPLTTDFFPPDKLLNNYQRYHFELSQVYVNKTGFIKTINDYLTEYICLRLTQNF